MVEGEDGVYGTSSGLFILGGVMSVDDTPEKQNNFTDIKKN